MKYVKTFESFSINEDTVYDTGLGGNLQYATSGDPAAVVTKSEITKRYGVGELVVHAFGEKHNKYYELTFPTAGLTADIIYWPLISFKNDNELKIAKDIWSYALGIEEGVDEYIKDKYLN